MALDLAAWSIFWLVRFCYSQQTARCDGCTVEAYCDPRTTIINRTGPDNTWISISSYDVIYSSFTNGACNKMTGLEVTLASPYSISSSGDDTDRKISKHVSKFLTAVGYENCVFESWVAIQPTTGLYQTLKMLPSSFSRASVLPFSISSSLSPSNPSPLSPSNPSPLSPSSPSTLSASKSSSFSSSESSSLFSSQPSPSHLPSERETPSALRIKDRIIVGFSVSTALTVSLIIAIATWIRYRTRKLATATTTVDNQNPIPLETDGQPYLQQKAEVGDKDRRVYEVEDGNGLERGDRAYEMDGEDEVHEIDH